MRTIVFLIILTILQTISNGQKISYDIPDGYQNNISKEDYKKIVDMAVPVIAKRYTIDFVKDGTVQL